MKKMQVSNKRLGLKEFLKIKIVREYFIPSIDLWWDVDIPDKIRILEKQWWNTTPILDIVRNFNKPDSERYGTIRHMKLLDKVLHHIESWIVLVLKPDLLINILYWSIMYLDLKGEEDFERVYVS